jgi:hypothetical protein
MYVYCTIESRVCLLLASCVVLSGVGRWISKSKRKVGGEMMGSGVGSSF